MKTHSVILSKSDKIISKSKPRFSINNPINMKSNLDFHNKRKSLILPKSIESSSLFINNNAKAQSKTISANNSKRSSVQIIPRPVSKLNSSQISIAQIIDQKKTIRIKKIMEEKFKNKELERLLKERDGLRNSLYNIIDPKTNDMIAKKMYNLSMKISKILNVNEELTESFEKDEKVADQKEDSFWKKRNESISNGSKDEMVDETNNNFNEYGDSKSNKIKITNKPLNIKEYFAKNNQIDKIFKEIELIEQNKKIDKKTKYDIIKVVPNFHFLRSLDEKTYVQAVKSVDTLRLKSYKPKGFRTEKLHIKNLSKPIKVSNKKGLINKSSRISKSSTLKQSTPRDNVFITDINQSPIKKRRVKSASSVLNTFGKFLNKSNIRSDIIKRFRKLIMELNVENHKNHDYLNKVFVRNLNDNKISKNIESEVKILGINKFDRYDAVSSSSDEEKENKNFLKKIDKRARNYFINYFKNVAFEKRMINNHNDDKLTFYERKVNQIKMQKEFKEIAYQTLAMEGIKEGEDIIYMKKELIKDLYSVESIEWQVKKHNVLKKLHLGSHKK